MKEKDYYKYTLALGILQIVLNFFIPNYVHGNTFFLAVFVFIVAFALGVVVLSPLGSAYTWRPDKKAIDKISLKTFLIILFGMAWAVYPFWVFIPLNMSI